jgi:hypothetical protein
MIKSSEHPTIIYTDHGASPAIAAAIKLTTSSTDRLNMKLIRASMYLSQFRLDIRHRSGKSNVIPDALSRLPVEKDYSPHGALDMNLDVDLTNAQSKVECPENDHIYAYATTLVEMSAEFRSKLKEGYQKESKWMDLIKMLDNHHLVLLSMKHGILDISSAFQNMIHMCVNSNLNFHKNFCHIARNLLRVGVFPGVPEMENVKPFQEQIKGNPLRVYKKGGHD